MIEVVITWQCLCVKKISIRVLHQQPITEPYMQVHVKKYSQSCFISLTKISLRLETFNRCLTIKMCFDQHFNIGMHITESQCEINCFF